MDCFMSHHSLAANYFVLPPIGDLSKMWSELVELP